MTKSREGAPRDMLKGPLQKITGKPKDYTKIENVKMK